MVAWLPVISLRWWWCNCSPMAAHLDFFSFYILHLSSLIFRSAYKLKHCFLLRVFHCGAVILKVPPQNICGWCCITEVSVTLFFCIKFIFFFYSLHFVNLMIIVFISVLMVYVWFANKIRKQCFYFFTLYLLLF